MTVRDHAVSYVNGAQVMVRGLSLKAELGYCRGALVRVTDPADPSKPAWDFIVQNDEHATLTSRSPPPPSWITAGTRIRIEVTVPDPAVIGASASAALVPPTSTSSAPRSPAASVAPAGASPPVVTRTPDAQTLFDAYVFVDWGSKSERYGASERSDALWLAEAQWGSHALEWATPPEAWFATRRDLIDHLIARLQEHVVANRRVLVGFDFPYGYPKNFAPALGLPKPYWRSLWRELRYPTGRGAAHPAPSSDYALPSNRNNRFTLASHLNARVGHGAGPLYGCPSKDATSWLAQTKPEFPFAEQQLAEYRIVEQALRGRALSPLSCWWVAGGGAPTVGGQILTGLPALEELCSHPALANVSRVWPFETGFGARPTPTEGPFVLHAEIWPGTEGPRHAAYRSADPTLIRDQSQVRAMIEWAASEDARGAFGMKFDIPRGLTPADRQSCEEEEGWILGA